MKQTKPLTKKQFIAIRTKALAVQLYRGLVSPEEAAKVTWDMVERNLPKAQLSQNIDTGVATLTVSLKGIRKLLKKNPYVTVEQVAQHFNLPYEVKVVES